MIDISLDTDGDILIEDFDLLLIDGIDQIVQNAVIRLKFFLGEWFLDITQGIPYYEEIFIKSPNQIRVESIFKEAILETDGIDEITSFSADFDAINRKFNVVFSALADNESLELEVQAP